MTERTYLIIDTETSGLKPENNGVCEIAWLEVSEEGEVLDQHYSLIDPEWPIAPAAQAVHGISQADVSEAPTLHEYFTIIHSEHPFDRDGLVFVAHQVGFDWGFLHEHFPRGAEQMDTLALARRFYPDSDNHKLPTLAVMLGLETFDHKKAHGALADVRVLWEFVQKMQEDFGLTLEELLALANEFVPVETCTYKKHQGKPWVRVWVEDPDYVTWVSAQPWCRADLRKTLEMIKAGEL